MQVLVQENSIYYYDGGQTFRPESPTLVFIHGALNNHSVWHWQSRHLAAQGQNVFALDLPGHGLSKGRAYETIEEMAHWLIAFLDTVDVNKAALVGHSMGSLIALETARIAPTRITKLALLGNAYPMKVSDALLTTAKENEHAAIDMVTKWSHYRTDPAGITFQGNTKQLMQNMAKINPDHLLYTDLSACNNYNRGEEAAAIITHQHCPTLFVTAQHDRMTPSKAGALLRTAIPEARVSEIAECGHAMMTEQPDAVLQALVGFLAKAE